MLIFEIDGPVPDFNFFSGLNILFAMVNFIPMIAGALIIYRRDPGLVLNKLYSLMMTILALSFALFPIGGLFYYVKLFNIRVLYISTRLVFFFGFLSLVFLGWCAFVLKDGEHIWNRSRNLFFVVFMLAINVIGLFTPDAVTLISGPEEIDTAKGLIYSLIFYPSVLIILALAAILFWQVYLEFKDKERILKLQSLMLATGSTMLIISFLTELLALYTQNHLINIIEFILMSIGIIVMSLGFFFEPSLLKLKISKCLYRIRVALERDLLNRANTHLDYLKALIVQDNSLQFRVRGLVLEGMIRSYQSDLPIAYSILETAYNLAHQNQLEDLQKEAKRHLNHLRIQETALSLYNSVEDTINLKKTFFSRENVLEYLDSLIEAKKQDL